MSTPEEKTKKVIEEIFKSFSLQYGLEEFKDIIILDNSCGKKYEKSV